MTGAESVKDASKSGRPVIVTAKKNVSKVREIIAIDSRYAIRHTFMSKAVCISLSQTCFILKLIFKSTKTFCQIKSADIDR